MNKKSVIYLSGGGDSEKTKAADEHFIKNIQQGNILFIPIGRTSEQKGNSQSHSWLKSKYKNLSKKRINIEIATELSKVKTIENSTVIYIGGGNTRKIMHNINTSHFDKTLEDYLNRGGTVFCSSAGAVLMGKYIDFIDERYDIDNTLNNFSISIGLSFIGNYSILPHYSENSYYKIVQYFRFHSNPVIAIPEGGCLVVSEKEIKALWGKEILLFQNEKKVEKISQSIFVRLYKSS